MHPIDEKNIKKLLKSRTTMSVWS